jgi:hypothetical protein
MPARDKRSSLSPIKKAQEPPEIEFVKVVEIKLVSKPVKTEIVIADLRTFIRVRFQDGEIRNCLVDTGSVCCCIGSHILKSLKRIMAVIINYSNHYVSDIDPSN